MIAMMIPNIRVSFAPNEKRAPFFAFPGSGGGAWYGMFPCFFSLLPFFPNLPIPSSPLYCAKASWLLIYCSNPSLSLFV